jgi:hypothetical protein
MGEGKSGSDESGALALLNEPLNPKQQWCAFRLAGFLSGAILGSGVLLLVWLPAADQLSWPLSCAVLRWVGLGGLLGGAARALFILKADLNEAAPAADASRACR